MIDILSISSEKILNWIQQDFTDDKSTIGSGDGLVPSVTKPLKNIFAFSILSLHWDGTCS